MTRVLHVVGRLASVTRAEVSTRAAVREARSRYEEHVAERGGRTQARDDAPAGSDEPDNA